MTTARHLPDSFYRIQDRDAAKRNEEKHRKAEERRHIRSIKKARMELRRKHGFKLAEKARQGDPVAVADYEIDFGLYLALPEHAR